MNRLNGKKTYLVALLMSIYAILGWLLGYLAIGEAGQLLFEALSIAGLRHGIAKL